MKITNSAMEKELFHENQYSSKEEIIFANYAKKESKVSFNFLFCNLSWFTNLFDFVTTTYNR